MNKEYRIVLYFCDNFSYSMRYAEEIDRDRHFEFIKKELLNSTRDKNNYLHTDDILIDLKKICFIRKEDENV